MNKQRPVRFVELYCGLGGFHQGIIQSGISAKCVFAYDRSSRVKKIYESNYKTVVHQRLDIPYIPAFDLLCCTPPDVATNWPVISDVVEHHRPSYIVLDLPKKCALLADMMRHLKSKGYHVYSDVLNSSHFGVPQYRERTFILCIKADINNTGFQWSDLVVSKETRVVRDIIGDDKDVQDARGEIELKYRIEPFHGRNNAHRPLQIHNLIRIDNGKGGRQGERIYSIDHPGIAICYCSGSPGSYTGMYDVDGKLRMLTVKEGLRMFGFPDSFHYLPYAKVPERMLRLLGESTTVPIIVSIIRRLFFSDEENRECMEKVATFNCKEETS